MSTYYKVRRFCFLFILIVSPIVLLAQATPTLSGVWTFSNYDNYFENTLFSKYRNFGLGINIHRSLVGNDSLSIMPAFLFENDNIKFYNHWYSVENHLQDFELKICFKMPTVKMPWVEFGVGSKKLIHIGFETGFANPHFGFGLSYVTYEQNDGRYNDLRGELWYCWDNIPLFAGIRRSVNQVVAIVSHPTTTIKSYPSRMICIYDENEEGFPYIEFTIGGTSRKGYYGLDPLDSWFFIQDSKIIGAYPIRYAEESPFRYVFPPVAWRVKDWGMGVQKNGIGDFSTMEFSLIKYILKDMVYTGLVYRRGVIDVSGFELGKVTSKVFFHFEGLYDFNEKEIIFAVKLGLLGV